MATSPNVLRARLKIYALVSAYLLLSLVGFAAANNGEYDRRAVVAAVGVNVISSVVFAVVFASLTGAIVSMKERDDLEDRFNELSDKLLGVVRAQSAYLPGLTFPATSGYDHVFNTELQSSLERSTTYAYFGPNPRYVPLRLAVAKSPPESLAILTLSPRDRTGLRRRAVDLGTSLSFTEIESAITLLQKDILSSVVALFDLRYSVHSSISFGPCTSVTRVEWLDDRVFISYYRTAESIGVKFPETVVFDRQTLPHATWRLESVRWGEVFDTLRITPDMSEEELERLLLAVTEWTEFPAGFSVAELRAHHANRVLNLREVILSGVGT